MKFKNRSYVWTLLCCCCYEYIPIVLGSIRQNPGRRCWFPDSMLLWMTSWSSNTAGKSWTFDFPASHVWFAGDLVTIGNTSACPLPGSTRHEGPATPRVYKKPRHIAPKLPSLMLDLWSCPPNMYDLSSFHGSAFGPSISWTKSRCPRVSSVRPILMSACQNLVAINWSNILYGKDNKNPPPRAPTTH